jgi:hypothetical protein
MNTLTDLRRTLDEHAADVADPAAVARTSAVHHRVAVVRRRRYATTTGLLALVLVGVSAALVLPRSDRAALPSGPTVLGVKAPTTQHALGYTYRTDGRSSTFAGSGTIDVHASDEPQLFSWTTDRPARVTLALPGHEVWHSDVTHFGDYVVIEPGESGPMKVSVASGSVGIASYDLTDAVPAGAYRKDGITFRKQVAGNSLLAATIGNEGATSVTTTFVPPHGLVSVSPMCTSLPKGDVVNVAFGNGGPVSSSACSGDGGFDPGSSSLTEFRSVHPGHTVRARVWISRGFHDHRVVPSGSIPDLRLGVGLYGPDSVQRVGGGRLARYVESLGHTWVLKSTASRTAGQTVVLPAAPVDRLAAMIWNTHGRTRASVGVVGETPTGSAGPGAGGFPDLWVPAGGHLRAAVTRGTGVFSVGFYERVD